ncbi:hypothetical protein CERSUDRAFT_93771 [Gelatoporia subvermispora B]|uniref:WD40 repeat-like protein n=1 Tax=Ceriporiopsis subvermispora (strain B) TaxID=914234 RepID=M2R144_CERS8|nr:hypothetical protein CERSUDRAFT_93771 [Gelatoporia subvermispora B]
MHTRTRLLVGCGAHVLVYDTSRSLPTKSIALEKKRIGEIVAIACSPFSKSLVAVACSGGYVSLLDIEKEKGLLRTLPMHVPVTSIAFSAKGDMLFIGTENGKLLLQSLRTLDQAPISVSVSESGSRIVALSVQRKLASDDATKGLNRPLVQQDVNKRPFAPVHSTEARKNGPDVPSRRPKLAISPIASKSHADVSKQRTASGSTVRGLQTSDKAASPTSSPARVSLREQLRRSRTAPAPESPLARRSIETQQRKAFSPPKSPALHARKASTDDMDAAHISVRMENLLPLRQAGVTVKENLAPYAGGAPAVPALSASAVSSISRVPPRTRDTQDVKASRARSRTTSSSGASTISSNALPSHNRLDKLLGVPSISTLEQVASTSRPTSPTQRIPIERRRGHVVTTRSPSPALPSPVEKPLSPEPQTYSRVKGKERMRPGTNVLGLGTPEADLWVRAGESRENEQAGKRVGFTEAHDDGADFDDGHRFEQDVDEVETARGGKKVGAEMHLSPRRNIPGTSSSWTPVPSPLRDPTVLPASPQVKAAQDLLQTLLRDALYDFRQETRQDITGLHLDMLRMGRSWRQEMRASMEELGSELRALREENERLRKENERLRRGY